MKVKPRYRGRARMSIPGSPSEISKYIPPEVESIACHEFIEFYQNRDIDRINVTTSLIEWVSVLDRIDDFLSNRNLSSAYLIRILGILRSLLMKTIDVRVFNSVEHLIDLLWHSDALVVLQNLHCITALLRNSTARISSRHLSPLRTRLQFLASGLILSDSHTLKAMYTGDDMPSSRPFTISGPSLDAPIVIDVKNMGVDPVDVASRISQRLPCSEISAFQINHRIAVMMGSELTRRVYVHIILRSIQAGILLPSSSNYVPLSGIVHVGQQIVALIEDLDRLSPVIFEEDVVITALQTLQLLASFDCYRRKMIEANIFEENGVMLNGFLLAVENVRAAVGCFPEGHPIYKRFNAYASLMAELVPSHGSSSVPDSGSRSDRLSVVGFAIDDDVVVRSLTSIFNCSSVCPFQTINDVCSLLTTLLLNNSAARSAFLDQNAFGPIFNQIRLVLDCAPIADSKIQEFHGAIQLLLRVISVLLQRTRVTISQQILPDVNFVRLMTHLWDTCMIGPSPAATPIEASRNSSTVDMRTLLMNTSEPPSSVSSPSHTPVNLSSTTFLEAPPTPFNPTESGLLVFTTACNIVSRFVQNRPRSLQTLHREGITSAYLHWFPLVLDSVGRCKSEYRESMIKILLDLIRSLSIHSAGLSAVLAADPVRRVLQLFESPDLFDYFSSSQATVQSVGRSVDEWIRHYPDFEEPVIGAITNVLTRLQDGPGALVFANVRDRHASVSAPTLEQVYDQAIINISSFIKCVVQRHIAKFCALNGPSQLCAFATAVGACQRILGVSRPSDSNESPPAFVFPTHPKSSALGAHSLFAAGKMTTAGDALAECYAWLAVQQARLPIDVLFDRLQKSCESIIRTEAFQSQSFLWPLEELMKSRRCEHALEQAATISALHFFVSTLLRIVHRAPSFQMRQAQLTSLFAMLSKITAKVDWALSGLDFDSSVVSAELANNSPIIHILAPYKFALTQFSLTIHGLMVALSERGSSRVSENNVFTSIVSSHAVYMINCKPNPVSPNLFDVICNWSDGSRQDSPTSMDDHKSLSASWCSLFLFTAKIFENARESLFCQKNSDSLSNQEVASVRVVLNELLKSGGITRLVELWRWIIEIRPNDHRDSSNPWGGTQSGATRLSSKKSRKTRNQSDAPTSMPCWQWPIEFDENLVHCLDVLLITLSRFIVVLCSLPGAAFLSIHDKFTALSAALFEDIWRSPGLFPLPVVVAMLQSSRAFAALHAGENKEPQMSASTRAPVPVSDTDEDQYDEDNDMDEEDGSQSAPDRDVNDEQRRSVMFAQLSEMGFADQHISWALDNFNIRNFNALVDWMFENPYTGPAAASICESVPAPVPTETASNNVPVSDPQPASPESAAFAAVEEKFLSVSIPNVDCLAVERALIAAPLLLSISNSFSSTGGAANYDECLVEYCSEVSLYILRVIAACKHDNVRILQFTEHFSHEIVKMANSSDINDPSQAVIIHVILSICVQVISLSKPVGKYFSSYPHFSRSVLRIANQLLSLSELNALSTHIALSISSLFIWMSSIWFADDDGFLPRLTVSSDDRSQMANICMQLLSSSVASNIEVTQSLLACLITLLSQCGIMYGDIKPFLLIRRPLSFDHAKTISALVDTILHMLIEDSCLVRGSMQKALKNLQESAEVSLSQFFDCNRNVILRSVQDFADIVVKSCQFTKKSSSVGSDFSTLSLRQRCADVSVSVEKANWCHSLDAVMDQIICMASNDSGASLSVSFTSALCDPLRLLHAIRTVAHLHSPHLHKYIIDYVGPARADRQYRFIDILVFKLLTIRGSNLRTDDCKAELSTTLAKDLRRAAQMTLIELCVAGDDIAVPVFECLRDAIRRDTGDDRCVARYATAVLSLLRNSPNERDRACFMIKIGIISTLVEALQSLNLKGQQFSECCDGILRTLEAFGSLDLTSALIRVEPDQFNIDDHTEENSQMDFVGEIVDQFPNQSSRNSSIEHTGADVVDSVQEMEEDNPNEEHGAETGDQEDVALIDHEDDEDVEDDVIAVDFINGLLNFGAPANDEYDESEYDEDDVDNVNRHNDDDDEDENDEEDDDELAVADLSSATINIHSSNFRGLHALSQRIFPQQLSQIVQLRRPVIDIGINFGNVAALNQSDERLRRVLDDFQNSVDTSDIDVLVSNGAVPINRPDDNTRRRLSTTSHRNIVVRATRRSDDELPWLNENAAMTQALPSRTQILRRSSVPEDGQRLSEIILDPNSRLQGQLQNRQVTTSSLSNTSWAARMMELSGSVIKESIGSYFMSEYHKQQVAEQQNESQQAQQAEPTFPSEAVADETESVASTNVAVSIASANAVGPTDVFMNIVEESATVSIDEIDENVEQIAEMSFQQDPTEDHVEEIPEQARSASAAAPNGDSASVGLSEEERLAFLAALPPELQAEILLQDSRQQAANANPEAINPSIVADIDSASFIATLPQDIREEFLMNQDDNFLSSLPPELMAEAVLLRQRNIYSERDEFPSSIRRRGQQTRLPASSSNEPISQPLSHSSAPLLPVRLVVPLISLFKVRDFDCLATVQRVIRVMSQFSQTRESLLKVLYSICVAFSPSRSMQPTKRLPSYLLSRALNTLRFLSKTSCRDEILLWFLLPEDSAPIYDILPLIYVARLDMSEATLLSLFGFLEDLLSVFQDGSSVSVQIKESNVTVPAVSSSAVANMVTIANAKVCTTRISDMIMSSISVFAKLPQNRTIIINELIHSLKAVRASLESFNLELRRSGEMALFQSMILRNLNLLKSVVPDFNKLDQESSTAILSCISDLASLWSELHRVLCSFQIHGPSNSPSGNSENTAVLEKSLQYKPFIEAMFVQRKIATTPALNKAFQTFCQTHRRILNFLCGRYPKLLSGTLSELITMRSGNILDFENKRRYFRSQLESQFSSFRSRYRTVKLQVRRSRLFEDSYHQIRNQSLNELKSHMTVHFMGEEGMDAGGLTREWFLVMSREIFNPNYALFRNAADSQVVFQPNKFSYWNPEHIDFFRFVGRFVGKAIYQGCLLDAYFTRSFYKHMLGIKPSFSDMESIDPDYFKSLKWMLANSIKGVLDLTFSAETHEFGERRVFALKANGQNIPVTDENKHEYVSLITELRTTTEIKAQIDAFVAGFHELIPKELISVFNDHDLELLICGLPEIDINDLRANTEYHGLSETSDVIQWFWAALQSFTSEEKALFIQFVTGTSKVPIGGFRVLQGMSGIQKFQIHRGTGIDRLPTTHTCFNQLDLPDYSSPDSLADKLRLAISEGATGFGFA